MHVTYTATDEDFHRFEENGQVKELRKQLNEGLISVVEFADAVLNLAYHNGLVK